MIQRGFTLIELALVGLFLSLLSIYAISQFSEVATDNVRGRGLFEAAHKIVESWGVITIQCGTVLDINLSPVGDSVSPSAAENLSVILGGRNPDAAYLTCYNRAGVKPLLGLYQGAAGSETINGYLVTIGMDTLDSRRLAISFAGVPDKTLLPVYNRYSSAAGASTADTVPAGANTTDPQIRFSAVAADSTRTVTIIKAM